MQLDTILNGDCLERLKELDDNSVDLLCTDPPYGIGFMGKEWDTFKPERIRTDVALSKRKEASDDFASPAQSAARYDHTNQGAKRFREWFTEISVEILRILKPGAFAFVCIGARQDSVSAAITAMTEAGFKTDFTSIYWTYASGFPKAMNIGKALDKRAGTEREVVGQYTPPNGRKWRLAQASDESAEHAPGTFTASGTRTLNLTAPATEEAKALDGSYAGFQPKPAVEVIIVAMKPLSETTFVNQVLKNRKGITWLDDARIPTTENLNGYSGDERSEDDSKNASGFKNGDSLADFAQPTGRFPANLLASDNAVGEEHSRYFNLDAWWEDKAKDLPAEAREVFPFLIVPKASKSEKTGSKHPTVKPIRLMSYLVTLGSRPGDLVLDPFCGSGTTCIAARILDRHFIGIEKEIEYCLDSNRRLAAYNTLRKVL